MILRLITGLGIAGGGQPINSRFEELGFKVATRDEPPDTGTPEGPDEADEDETALTLEIDLENSLVGNLDQLEKGLKVYRDGSRTGQ